MKLPLVPKDDWQDMPSQAISNPIQSDLESINFLTIKKDVVRISCNRDLYGRANWSDFTKPQGTWTGKRLLLFLPVTMAIYLGNTISGKRKPEGRGNPNPTHYPIPG